MRSFSLLTRILFFCVTLFVIPVAHAVDSLRDSADFFTVVFPYEEATAQNAEAQQSLDSLIHEGLKTLLFRVTGSRTFVESEQAAVILQKPRVWLRTYDIMPRIEEGVQVGRNIVLRYSERKLRQAFQEGTVAIWPLVGRASTYVMGSIVQSGQVIKLDADQMQYRMDVDYRSYVHQARLAIALPENTSSWVYPVEPKMNLSLIQETLMRTDHDYLMSFKLVSTNQPEQPYRLTWYVYANSGEVVSHNEIEGTAPLQLIEQMFDAAIMRYVEIDAMQASIVNQSQVRVHNVFDVRQIQALELQFKKQIPMVTSAKLTSVEAGSVVFDVVYQGDPKKFGKWVRYWPQTEFLDADDHYQQVNVKIDMTYFAQSGNALLDELIQEEEGVINQAPAVNTTSEEEAQ